MIDQLDAQLARRHQVERIPAAGRSVVAPRPTLWIDEITGAPIDADQLGRLRRKAHFVYLRNSHIFEDEADALAALGAVPDLSARGGWLGQGWLGGHAA